jgi:hypothetical protein
MLTVAGAVTAFFRGTAYPSVIAKVDVSSDSYGDIRSHSVAVSDGCTAWWPASH